MRETIDKFTLVKIKKFYITKITPQGKQKLYHRVGKNIQKIHLIKDLTKLNNNTNNPNKWAKNQNLTKEDIQMENKHMRRIDKICQLENCKLKQDTTIYTLDSCKFKNTDSTKM